MGELMNLAVYNPAILNDQDFLKAFVARGAQAQSLLDALRDLTPDNLAKHHLILGQRGMGKTTLLRRIGLGVRDDPKLTHVLLPLSFREEQYNVHDLHSFWLNCLDALADHLERSGQADRADALDRKTAALTRDPADPEGAAARELFEASMKEQGRRALLLLDNIDLILDGLEQHDWSLRRILQQPGGIVVVGATAGYLESTEDPQAAFYDFFRVTVLEPLDAQELRRCLNQLAAARGDKGNKVKALVAREPARIRTLHDLTGGNPRTLVLLYLLLELDAGGDVFRDLERLLDQVTPLYKARIEDLAPQARLVLDALALHWDPATAARLSDASGLTTSTVSSQLERLRKLGLLEKVTVSTSKRAAFQLGERFFNIWYLMRHGPRRQRTRLRWLTGFLQGFYTPEQLRERGKALLLQRESAAGHHDYILALSEAVNDPGLRNLLGMEGRKSMEKYARDHDKRLEDLTDPDDLPQPKTAQDWFGMGWWLHEELERYEEAERVYRLVIDIQPWFSPVWNNLANLLMEKTNRFKEAEQAYRRAIEIDSKSSHPWNGLGNLLMDHLNRPQEAEHAYRRAIELNPKAAYPWNGLGNLLMEHLNRPKEAEQAFRHAIELDSKYNQPWNGLGNLLSTYLNRPEEAERAYRCAIKFDAKCAIPWNGLGNLLKDYLDRPEEAEQAYRRAIELDSKYSQPWNGLGELLRIHLNYFDESEQAYRQAIKLDSKNIEAWNGLGELLRIHTNRMEEAEQAYRRAIELDPKYAHPWNNLANLLMDHLECFEKAEQAYRRAIELDPEDKVPRANLAFLLCRQKSRFHEGEILVEQLLNQLPSYAAALLQACCALAQDNFGKAVIAYGEALDSEDPALLSIYQDDVLYFLRFAAKRGYGDRLLGWMDERGLGDRYWPLRAAFDAYLHGEERLLDVNPEVRSAARRLFTWLDRIRPGAVHQRVAEHRNAS